MSLDLAAKHLDVRRLAKAHPSFRGAVSRGHDPDELLQEVWIGVLVRQQGRTPYDPSRGSFSKWLYQVVRSVVHHVEEKAGTRARKEQTGCRDEIEGAEVDAGLWAQEHEALDIGDDERRAILAVIDPHSEVALYLVQGHTLAEARRWFGPRWATEIERVAGRVRLRLVHSEPRRTAGGDRDKS